MLGVAPTGDEFSGAEKLFSAVVGDQKTVSGDQSQ
jgi:hypothetical protein